MTPGEQQFRAELVRVLPRLRRFARALSGRREDADDLLQIALERALLRRLQWEPGTQLLSWLFKIINNAWIDEMRSRGRRDKIFAAVDAAESASVEARAHPVDAIALRRAVEQLTEEQRIAVALVLVEGLTYKEAAEVLGVPMGTVTSRLARAREQLQALLSPTETPAAGAVR